MPQRALTTLLLILSLALAAPALAQKEPVADFGELVEVTEVLLDVLVTDRSGETVTGLGKDDFVVEENGEPVDVTGVSYYTTRYGPGGEILVEDGAVPSSRYFIFFFHDQSRAGGNLGNQLIRQQLEAGRESRRWVEEQMLPSDWVAVLSYDYKLKIHQDFTQDRHSILEALSNAVQRKDPEKNLGRGGRPLPELGQPSLLRNLPQGKKLRDETKNIHDGIRLTAEAAGHVVGRKNMLLFSIGFGEFRTATRIPLPDNRYYPQMEQALNDHNVAVYTIDVTPFDVEHLQVHFLSTLANDTGGYFFENFVSFITPLEQISKENNGYYLLSYQSEHPAKEAGFQEVKVKASDKSLKVRARKGYRYGAEG